MEHCDELVQNISDYFSSLQHHKQYQLITLLYHLRIDEREHVPPLE